MSRFGHAPSARQVELPHIIGALDRSQVDALAYEIQVATGFIDPNDVYELPEEFRAQLESLIKNEPDQPRKNRQVQ